jgi:hypothetical protein
MMEAYFFGILVVVLVFTGVTGGLGVLIYLGAQTRKPRDASNLNLKFPQSAQATVDRLVALGFQRLGETYTQMPLAISPGPTWILVDGQRATQAEIVEINPGTFYTSVFADGAVIETGFPQGENIITTNFISQTVTTSIEDAFHQHLQYTLDFQAKHGAPEPIRNMEDYLHWDGMYRKHYARLKMRRMFLVDLAQVLALLYGIVVSLVVWQLWQRHAPVPQWVTDWDRGLFLLLSPAFCVSAFSILIGMLGSRRKRAKVGQE